MCSPSSPSIKKGSAILLFALKSVGSSSGQALSTSLPVSSVSSLSMALQHCHTHLPAITTANTSMFPADPGYHCCLPQGAAPTSPVSCPFPSVGCSTQRAGRWSSWDLHTGMRGLPLPAEQCPRKETQHMGAIGEERRRPVIWARVASDALSNSPPFLDRARAHNGLIASCSCSHGRQLLHICFTLDRVSPCQTKPSLTFFLLIPHVQIHRCYSGLLLMQYCR